VIGRAARTLPAWLGAQHGELFRLLRAHVPLENEIVVFTESRFADRIHAARAKLGYSTQTKIIAKDRLFEEHADRLETIARIMRQPGYLDGVTHPHCPEYWEPRYVLINYLKSTFACEALDSGLATGDFAAWIDFGYCRDEATLPKSLKWDYPVLRPHPSVEHRAAPIHRTSFRSSRPIRSTSPVPPSLRACGKWPELKRLMQNAFDMLVSFRLMDDDQTLLLMSYRAAPHLFETHYVDAAKTGWFIIFKDYNIYEGRTATG
jgi:hypothetical protein